MEYIKTFISDVLLILNEMSPYLLLGLFFAGLLKVFLPESFIDKYLRKSNLASVLNATILGIPLPLCSCGVLPTGIALHKNGASKGATTAFLTATPQTGVDSILVTYAMLGLPMAIIRPIVALISGIFGGLLTNKLTKNEPQENYITTSQASTKHLSFIEKLIEAFRYGFFVFLSDIAKWLIIGTLIASFISVALPDNFFEEYIPSGPLELLLILISSVPLYICATASVPIATILMGKGISVGAILVFLMAGPATNVASFTLIGQTLGRKTMISYLIGIIGSALFFGFLINTFLPKEWFVSNLTNIHQHSHGSESSYFQMLCTVFLLGCIVYIYIQNYLNKHKSMETLQNAVTFSVPDMTCNHCKKSLENAFNNHKNVTGIQVNLDTKAVQISGNITEEEIKNIIKDLGFNYVK